MKTLYGSAMLLLFLGFSKAAIAKTAASDLDQRLEALLEGSGFPGFAVAKVDRGGVLYSRGFGLADVEHGKPFTDKTVLNIGSVSKTFIGVALMQAVERELVDLDADINTYLPYVVRNPRFKDEPISLRQLATHTSSIQDRVQIYLKSYSAGEQPRMSLAEYLESYASAGGRWFSKKNFAAAAPGTSYEYSNIGAALAAHVLEHATGTEFDAWTTQHILKPLAMDDSGWSYAAAARDQHAILYEEGEIQDPYTLVTYPDGGLRTSVASLSRYLAAVLGHGRLGSDKILESDSVDAMLSGQFGGQRPDGLNKKLLDSGIFWSHRDTGSIGHSGGDPGITTFLAFDPVTGIGRIFVTNTSMEEKRQTEAFQAIWQALEAADFNQ